MVQAEQRPVRYSLCGESETITKELGRKSTVTLDALTKVIAKQVSCIYGTFTNSGYPVASLYSIPFLESVSALPAGEEGC